MTIVQRESIRAILLPAEQEVLLLRIHEPGVVDYSWWIAPGGGVEEGETVEQTLRRELREEVGLTPLSLAEILARYLERGAPQPPLELEVLVGIDSVR